MTTQTLPPSLVVDPPRALPAGHSMVKSESVLLPGVAPLPVVSVELSTSTWAKAEPPPPTPAPGPVPSLPFRHPTSGSVKPICSLDVLAAVVLGQIPDPFCAVSPPPAPPMCKAGPPAPPPPPATRTVVLPSWMPVPPPPPAPHILTRTCGTSRGNSIEGVPLS